MKRVAILGCGKSTSDKEGWAIGHDHADGYLTCGHEVELMGVDVSPENLRAFGEKFGLPPEQLFSSTEALYQACVPDCVSICTWPALHYPMVVEALENGVRGIACEKPFTLDVDEQRELEKRVTDAGAVLVIAHQRRLEPAFKALKEVALSGKVGERLETRGCVGDGWDILTWTTHWFDMANFFFDAAPDYVMAGMEVSDTQRYRQAVEDASIIYADYGEKGSATFLTGPGALTEFAVHGSMGMARIGDGVIEIARFDGHEIVPFEKSPVSGFAVLVKELIDALDGGAEPMCSIRRCAIASEMAYAAHESARTRRKVALPLAVQFAPLEMAQHPIQSGLRGRQILLYADTHFDSGGREGIAEALLALTGKPVRMVDAETSGISERDLEGVDAVAIYHTQKESDSATRKILSCWVDEGKPLLIIHAGLGAWPEWEDYSRWCGKIWEWGGSEHPYEPTTLQVASGDPLAFGWSEAWLPKDEVYVKLKDTAEIKVGLTATISTGVFAAAWVNRSQPNIGAWMPGHRKDSWLVPAMREGVAQMLLHLCSHS